MSSARSLLGNDRQRTVYLRNRAKSLAFLTVLAAALIVTGLLALRAGSYETLLGELIKGIFGRSARQ